MLTLSSVLNRMVGVPGQDRAEALLLASWVLICQREALQVTAGHQAADVC